MAARSSRPPIWSSPRSTSATTPTTSSPARPARKFNIRYNDKHTQASLRELVETRLAKACGNRIKARIVWEPSNSNVFVTKPGPFTELAVVGDRGGDRTQAGAVEHQAAPRTHASSRSYCPVIEFGLVGQTMHQVDERVPVVDLEKLTKVYRGILKRYFG